MRNRPLDLGKMVRTIEMDDSVLEFLTVPTTRNALEFSIDRFKEMVKKQRKKLSLKYHPDIGGNPERMKEINGACDLLLKLQLPSPSRRSPPPRPPWGEGIPKPPAGTWRFSSPRRSPPPRPPWGAGTCHFSFTFMTHTTTESTN